MFCKKYSTALLAACTAFILLLSGCNFASQGRSNEEIRDLYRACRLLLFPGEEDFGIVPLEAQACGRPVVAYGRGGALETILDGRTGVFFSEQTETALLAAVERAAALPWQESVIRRHAEQFGPQAYLDGLDKSIRACLK